MLKEPRKQNIVRQISSCIIEKYNGYQAISIVFARKETKKKLNQLIKFLNQLKTEKKSPLCYFTKDISKPYHNLHSVGKKTKHGHTYECYYCRKFFTREDRQKKHIKSCSGIPGAIYNFNTKSLISFQDNLNSKGDIPFVMYFDFETAAPTDNIFDPEQKRCSLYHMF